MIDKKISGLKHLPCRPGCYLFRDGKGGILYIGKAVNLRSRVRSYFRKSANHTQRIEVMVSLARKVDFIVTGSEVEALILENNLIKKESPRFNVMLRDDKTYPYIKITTNEKFPRLQIVRKVQKDDAHYFGPYVSGKSVRAAKQMIYRIFPLRSSMDNLDNAPLRRPCLNYQMKRCLAPCAGKVTEEEYADTVNRVIKFLSGKDNEIVTELDRKMKQAARKQEFERAAALRDQIFALHNIHERQKVDSRRGMDEDYIAAICEGGVGIVRIMMVRGGKLTGDKNFNFRKVDDPAELTGAFIQQFYNSAFAVPAEVMVNVLPNDSNVISDWLSGLRGHKSVLLKPSRGRKKQLLDMALENAKYNLLNFTSGEEARKDALGEIKKMLALKEWPTVMEAVDISNISGLSAVGSLVTFFNGEPSKKDYKRYKVLATGPDDYAMIAEVVRRRFRRLAAEGNKFPDVLLIDGGVGQVSAAVGALKDYAPGQVVVGIAKGKERENSATDRIFINGGKYPLPFPPSSAGKFMLQRLRDEAHRFAIQYHRQTREKSAFKSGVDNVHGFGPKRKKMLVKAFGSLKEARKASVEELQSALSISEKLAVEILGKL